MPRPRARKRSYFLRATAIVCVDGVPPRGLNSTTSSSLSARPAASAVLPAAVGTIVSRVVPAATGMVRVRIRSLGELLPAIVTRPSPGTRTTNRQTPPENRNRFCTVNLLLGGGAAFWIGHWI